jgi:predicted transcriptional regulator
MLTSVAAFSCDYPARPFIPDGATASKDELIAAKNGVQEFLVSVDEYLQCIELEHDAAVAKLDNPTSEQQKELSKSLDRKFDAANEEKEMVGEQFNQQVRAYNGERKKSD